MSAGGSRDDRPQRAPRWLDIAQSLKEANPDTHPLHVPEFAAWYDSLPGAQKMKVLRRFLWQYHSDPDDADMLFKPAKNLKSLKDKVWEAKIGKHGEALRVYYQRAPHQKPRARLLFGSNTKGDGDQQRSIQRAKELAQRPFEA